MPTKQNPAGSGFGPATTAKETLHDLDLTGKVAIATGGYAGIGLETTRVLAGARTVIVSVRALDNPNFENRPYDWSAAYGQAKTANILLTVKFSRCVEEYFSANFV
jgi:hypothetical protein